MSIGPGALVRVRNLVSRPELNGRTATVKSRDEKRQRWNCWVDGEEKKLSLREENLQLVTVDVLDDDDDEDIFEPSNSSAAAGKATGDRADRPSASAGKRKQSASAPGSSAAPATAPAAKAAKAAPATASSSTSKQSSGKASASTAPAAAPAPAADKATEAPAAGTKAARKRPMPARSQGPSASPDDEGGSQTSTKWSRKNRRASDAWEAALDAMQPQEDDADEGKRAETSAGAAAAGTAAASAAAPRRDPRMKAFRIGGQSETEAERGEGWCGPWSTASRLIEARDGLRPRPTRPT